MMKNKMMYGKQIKRWISVFLTVIMFFTTTVADYLTGGQCTVLAQEKTATGMMIAGENTSRMDLYAKAEELQTPLAIYNFVRNNINYEYYGDMRKGAQATYDSLAGNDVDIACLLSTMLNAAGYETRYVSGTIRVDQRLAEKMTGTADVRIAADILALSGYHVVVVRDGAGNAVCLEIPHTWVECYLPYTDYRGNGNNRGEWLWVPLDAGIKNYEDTDSIYAHAEEMGTTESSVTAFISEHPELYVVKRKIKQENLCYLPLSLPYETVGETNRSTEYSGATDCIIFTLGAGSSIRLSSPELYNKRLTLVYEECDGMVRPELMLEGKMIAAGSLMEKGENHIFTMTVQSGKRKNVIENTLRAGSMYAIITDMQSITSKELEKARMELLGRSASVSEKNIYTEEYLGVLLDYAGKMYFAQVDIADRMIAEEMNVTQVRSLSVGMVGYSVTTELENGVITGISEGTLVTDIDLDFHMAVSDTGNAEDVKKYMLASGMMSSAYEGAIWEQITGIPSVSTVSILNEAKECGIPVLCITGENLEDALSGLSVEADVLREIRQEAASGKMVIIPKENITIGDWNGTGYIVLEPEHYTGRYMICGGIRESGSTSGGSTGVSVYLAYLVNLFMSSVDIAQSLGLVEVVLGAMELGGVIGCVLGISTYLLCVTLFVLAVEEYK
ncbi:MAG: transglutaminase family protein, partial [Lachnospiraceae bacterium]